MFTDGTVESLMLLTLSSAIECVEFSVRTSVEI
jgi:hypothetical protein